MCKVSFYDWIHHASYFVLSWGALILCDFLILGLHQMESQDRCTTVFSGTWKREFETYFPFPCFCMIIMVFWMFVSVSPICLHFSNSSFSTNCGLDTARTRRAVSCARQATHTIEFKKRFSSRPVMWSIQTLTRYDKIQLLMAEIAACSHLQCEAPKISKLVYNSNNYGLRYL
jgi:hypothetical protein